MSYDRMDLTEYFLVLLILCFVLTGLAACCTPRPLRNIHNEAVVREVTIIPSPTAANQTRLSSREHPIAEAIPF